MMNMKLFLVILFLSVPVETQPLCEQKVYEEAAQEFIDQHPIWFKLSWIKSSLLSFSENRIADIREKRQKVSTDDLFSNFELPFPETYPIERVIDEITVLQNEVIPSYSAYISSHCKANVHQAAWNSYLIENDAERQYIEVAISKENEDQALIEEELAFHKAFIKLLNNDPGVERSNFLQSFLSFWR